MDCWRHLFGESATPSLPANMVSFIHRRYLELNEFGMKAVWIKPSKMRWLSAQSQNGFLHIHSENRCLSRTVRPIKEGGLTWFRSCYSSSNYFLVFLNINTPWSPANLPNRPPSKASWEEALLYVKVPYLPSTAQGEQYCAKSADHRAELVLLQSQETVFYVSLALTYITASTTLYLPKVRGTEPFIFFGAYIAIESQKVPRVLLTVLF